MQALEIFEGMQRAGLPRDAITYSAVISSLAKGKQWHAALACFEHMQARGRHEGAGAAVGRGGQCGWLHSRPSHQTSAALTAVRTHP